MANLNWYFEIDWDEDGNFTERNEASRVIDFFSRRGRQDYIDPDEGGFKDWDIGYCEFVLDDEDRLYDPNNTSSDLYPNVVPGKLCRIRVQEGAGTIEGVFAGEIVDIRPISLIPREVKVVVRGLEDKLRTETSIALQEDQTADYNIDLILTDIDYPSEFGWDLNAGADEIPYWWVDDKSAKVACFDLATSELGNFYISNTGEARYKSRYDLGSVVETYTQDQILKKIGVPMPWDWVRNFVTLGVHPRQEGSSQALWDVGDVINIRAGEELEFWGEFKYEGVEVPVKSPVTPQATTDYLLNAQADGGGANLTADLSIETFTVYGTSFYIKIKNNGATSGYVTFLQVRANPVYVANKILCKSNQSGGGTVRKFSMDLLWQQSVIRGITFSDFLANALKTMIPTPRIQIEKRFAKQFGPDLTEVITTDLDAVDIDEDLAVGYIEHRWLTSNGQSVVTLLHTEPVFDLSLYWYFPAEFTMYFGL